MAKLPAKLRAELLKVQDQTVPHFANIINKMDNQDASLPEWISEKPVDYYKGLLDGAYVTIEVMLMAYNCYGGFSEDKERGHRVYPIK